MGRLPVTHSPTKIQEPMMQMAALAIAAVFVLVGYLFGIMTMRVGDIGFISPFRYTILIWAILLGIIVFGDFPDSMTIIGAVIVVLTGLYTFYRERLFARANTSRNPAVKA